jgi:serine/threonine protein kinase/Flp pilus assembly protein TadD
VIGKLLDRRYHITEYLGAGSFGQTYLAKDIRRPGNPKCVVKYLRPIRNTPQALQATRRRFQREAQTLEKLGKHDQIPLLLAYFEAKQEFCLVEEYIAGHTVASEIVPGVPWTEDAVIELLQEILEILVFVHQHQVIHRDVTPANLIRRAGDRKLVLIDFGAVKEITNTLLAGEIPKTVATGTPVYMPLEQFRGYPQFNSDIYAVGMIAIQALAGVAAKELAQLKNPLQPAEENLWKQRVQISPELSEILEKMVHSDCRERYQSAQEVLTDLKTLSAGALMESLPTILLENSQPAIKRSFKFLKTHKHWIALAGGILTIAGVVLLLQIQAKIQAKEFYHRGNQRADQGDLQGALSDYTQALQLDPKNQAVYLSRGNLRLQIGAFEEAIADYTQLLQLNPTHAGAFAHRCDAQLQRSAPETALSDCSTALQLNPNLASAYRHRCAILLQLNAPQRALADCSKAVELDPNHAGVYVDRGLVRSKLADHQGAGVDFTKALELSADEQNGQLTQFEPAFNNRNANSCLPQNQNECATAFNINFNQSQLYINRCIAQLHLDQYQNAITNCSHAIQLQPQNANAYNYRGLARSTLGDWQGALSDYTQAIQLNPEQGDFYLNRGNAYYQLKDLKKALADYNNVIQRQPNAEIAYYGRGQIQMQLGHQQQSIQDFQKASQLCLDKGMTQCYYEALNQIKKVTQKVTSDK